MQRDLADETISWFTKGIKKRHFLKRPFKMLDKENIKKKGCDQMKVRQKEKKVDYKRDKVF